MTPNDADEYTGDDSIKSSTATKQHDVPKFLLQLFDILEAESSAVIKWADDGGSLQILDPVRATQEILPKYFSHNNFQSFQRQLNYFGFRKWTKTKTYICTFSHPCFKKNEPDKLQLIKRKSVPKRTRINGHLVTERRPVFTKKRSTDGSSTSTTPCPIRPYGLPLGRPPPAILSEEMKVSPADMLLFPKQPALPNLCKIRSSLMLRLEATSPPLKISPTAPKQEFMSQVHPVMTDRSEEDPVNLLLGIKQASPPSPTTTHPQVSFHPQQLPEQRAHSPTMQAQLAAALDEVARLKATLQDKVREIEWLRAQCHNAPPG
ncbi:hypothetical protein DYB30_004401 [Aphanomyces astaci]|uniref:HSF-type DNA-binding domain-containing protein n=1 Tax=Aphanomyces astaci TaxID=112090 RepID=A0A397CHV1_APHAT|nr:hypothetical protein DYB36_002621 [Aphanomyces astaci]RHY43856.1 hypothetical protein DYB30_004401 [Aphanomyces astaci]RHY80046.1 hypothetical protein DYB31_001061 [Aphanomyces astaci]